MTKIVVTGEAGFIGSHLAEELAQQDYHVTILDDFSTEKIKNIEPLLRKDNVDFIQGSIVNLPLLQKLFRGVDYVFHEAAIPSVPRSIEKPLISHEVNIPGTLAAAKSNSTGAFDVGQGEKTSIYWLDSPSSL